MSERSDKAVELFKNGYNCSQAVFAAYADLFGIDGETALKISAGLGGGVGRSREVCGTVTGATLLIGLKYGETDGSNAEGKKLCYEKVQEYIAEFRKLNCSIICRELLGLDNSTHTDPNPTARTESFYKQRPCAQIVEDSAKAVEKILFKESSI